MSPSTIKHALARGFDRTGINAALHAIQSRTLEPHIRAINYHDVPHSHAGRFEEQVQFFARHYAPVDLAGLRALFRGEWREQKPGLLISFDDGLRTHSDVAAPILEKYGFCGWFMVPIDFVDVPVPQQATWAVEHDIRFSVEGLDDGRIALRAEDLRRLSARHVIGCHTRSHRRLTTDLDEAALENEIPTARRVLEDRLGKEISVFTWVGGEEHSYSERAAQTIREAGFEFSFMTNSAPIRASTHPLQLQRSNIEADFPIELTRLVLSGFYDLLYWPKRRRVNRLTRTPREIRRS